MSASSSGLPAPAWPATLRRLLSGLADAGTPDSVAAGHAYLDLVQETPG
jgi:hypothetical protein